MAMFRQSVSAIKNFSARRFLSIASESYPANQEKSSAAEKPAPPEPAAMGGQLDPLTMHDAFSLRHLVTVRDLFDARAHLGHKESLRHPYMTPYIFGNRQGIDIIDLDQTVELLGDALNFVAHVAYRGGVILFVSRNRQMMPLIERVARDSGEYSHCRPWGGSVFTDADKYFGVVTRLPDLVICPHTLNNVFETHSAILDANKMLIPIVGVVDTNCDPRLINYPIPGNDDSPASVRLWVALFQEAIARGKRRARRSEAAMRQVAAFGGTQHAALSLYEAGEMQDIAEPGVGRAAQELSKKPSRVKEEGAGEGGGKPAHPPPAQDTGKTGNTAPKQKKRHEKPTPPPKK